MSTHGFFAPPFPLLSSFWLSQPDGGTQDPDDTTDDYYYPEDTYYFVEAADDQE